MNIINSEWEGKVKQFPKKYRELKISLSFTEDDLNNICKQHTPSNMEDKWYVAVHDTNLDIYRSWTGKHLYQIPLVFRENKYEANLLKVNRSDFGFIFVWLFNHRSNIQNIIGRK